MFSMGPARETSDDPSDDVPPDASVAGDGRSAVTAIFGDEAKSGEVDARAFAAWRSWLGALASDPKAAMAAALAYESLAGEGRDAWLTALEDDAPGVRVPPVALYAPLLAVEGDAARRARIETALEEAGPHDASRRHALRGTTATGDTLCVIVSPLYLDFVELLVCRIDDAGVKSARHEPLTHLRDEDAIPEADGAELELTPMPMVVEELAHAVVAHQRSGKPAPEALQRFTHLFAPAWGSGDE